MISNNTNSDLESSKLEQSNMPNEYDAPEECNTPVNWTSVYSHKDSLNKNNSEDLSTYSRLEFTKSEEEKLVNDLVKILESKKKENNMDKNSETNPNSNSEVKPKGNEGEESSINLESIEGNSINSGDLEGKISTENILDCLNSIL